LYCSVFVTLVVVITTSPKTKMINLKPSTAHYIYPLKNKPV